jgi:hypothetical protein
MFFRNILDFRNEWYIRKWNKWEELTINWKKFATYFSKIIWDFICYFLVRLGFILKVPSIILRSREIPCQIRINILGLQTIKSRPLPNILHLPCVIIETSKSLCSEQNTIILVSLSAQNRLYLVTLLSKVVPNKRPCFW